MKTVIIGEKYREKLEIPLKNHGFDIIYLPKNPDIDTRLAYHADLSIFKRANKIVLAQYLRGNSIVNNLTSRGYDIIFSKTQQGAAYPEDINLCAADIGGKLLHNIKYTDKTILNLYNEKININQAYSRCTISVIDEHSIITADRGIYNAIKNIGFDILLINEIGISLEGFSCGFIGGASFKAEDTIYFTGDIYRHPSGDKIVSFIEERNLKCCSLTSDQPFDIGGAVFLEN